MILLVMLVVVEIMVVELVVVEMMLVVVEKMVVKMVVAVPLEAWCGKYVALIWSILKYTMILTAAGPKCAPFLPAVHPGRTFATASPSAKGLLKKTMKSRDLGTI